MSSSKDRAAQRVDLHAEATRLLVKIGAVRVCRHDMLIGLDTSKMDMSYAMAANQIRDGVVDAPLNAYRDAVKAVLTEAEGGFCPSCDKDRRKD